MTIGRRAWGAIGWCVGPVWVAWMRWQLGAGRRGFTPRERAELERHFAADTLDGVGIVQRGRIGLVPRSVERVCGRRLRLARPVGLTLDDLIVLARGAADERPGLLFHEMVHVVQFAVLGRRRFAARYLADWSTGGFPPESIALERDAYELQARYVSEPDRGWDAEAEIRRRLAVGGA